MTDAPDPRTLREELPNRRTGGAIDFRYGNINATLTVFYSCYPDSWRCAEVFLNIAPTQGDLEKNVRDAGILASFALQHGASLDLLVAGVTHESDGGASSIIGHALGLVRDEIARMRGSEDEELPPPDDVPPAGGGAEGAVVGGEADDPSVPEREGDRVLQDHATPQAPELVPADPKEMANDGDPIRLAAMIWPYCRTCQCRHAPSDHCPGPDALARRHTRMVAPSKVEP